MCIYKIHTYLILKILLTVAVRRVGEYSITISSLRRANMFFHWCVLDILKRKLDLETVKMRIIREKWNPLVPGVIRSENSSCSAAGGQPVPGLPRRATVAFTFPVQHPDWPAYTRLFLGLLLTTKVVLWDPMPCLRLSLHVLGCPRVSLKAQAPSGHGDWWWPLLPSPGPVPSQSRYLLTQL